MSEYPLLDSDPLRFQVFRYFYLYRHNEFDLYRKADSMEFLQNMLELVHFCLNTNKGKKDVDSSCGNECQVHRAAFLATSQLKECRCEQTQTKDNQNKFCQIINAYDILEARKNRTVDQVREKMVHF